jgi:hypothetical protein
MLVRVKNSIIAWNSPLLDFRSAAPGFRRLFHNDANGSRKTRDFAGNGYYNWDFNNVSQFSTDNNGFNALGVPDFFTTADGDSNGKLLVDRPFLRPTVSPDLIPGSEAARSGLGARSDNGAQDLPLDSKVTVLRPNGGVGPSKPAAKAVTPAK